MVGESGGEVQRVLWAYVEHLLEEGVPMSAQLMVGAVLADVCVALAVALPEAVAVVVGDVVREAIAG